MTGRRVFALLRRGAHGSGGGPLSAPPSALRVTAAAVLASLILGGCGGGARQDAHEPVGSFTFAVHAGFPTKQSIARPTTFALAVRNLSARTAPNVAVTLDSFYYSEHYPELAASKRPVWIVEDGPGVIPARPVESEAISPPGGGQTAYVNTWAFGPLAPGRARAFLWRVVPVKAGLHTLDFTVAAGLAGKAKARLASGAPVHGGFTVYIAPVPPARHVNPDTGQVVPGPYPPVP